MMIDSSTTSEVRQILESHGLPSSELVLSDGFANLVVLTPSHVIRLNAGRFPQAFAHESRVLSRLPQDIPHPIAVAHGNRKAGGEYLILERLPGVNLETAWSTLTPFAQRRVVSELARIVERMHALPVADWMRNPWVDETLATKRWRDAYHAPPQMGAELVESAIAVRPGLHRLLREVDCFIGDRLRAFGDEPWRFVHTDLHFRNVIVADGHVTGLIDFEGSRPGPIDVELDMLIRSLATREETSNERYRDVVPTFRSVYPALFAHPNLTARLEVYETLWNLVQLHHWTLGDRWMDDPAESLRRLLEGNFAASARELMGG